MPVEDFENDEESLVSVIYSKLFKSIVWPFEFEGMTIGSFDLV